MENENENLEQKLKQAIKTFDGIGGTFSSLLRPPNDLGPEKRGILVCLTIGTIGVVALAYINAPWYAFIAEATLVSTIAILVGHKRRKNG